MLIKVILLNYVIGMIGMNSVRENSFESCIKEKTCKKSPRIDGRRTKRIMELWHVDLIGPIKPTTYGDKRYILTMVDDFSRIMFTKLISHKSEAAGELKRTIKLKENQIENNLTLGLRDNLTDFKF